MSKRYPLVILAAAVVAAALLCGCDRTAEGTAADDASVTATCPQTTQTGDPICSAAGSDCAGCPAMGGTEVVEADQEPETHTCPYAEGQECPEGCTCEKVKAADGTIVCAHDPDCPAALDGSCPAAHEESCPAAQSGSCPHAVKQTEVSGAAATAETPVTTCPKACGAAGTCPRSGEAS